MFTDGERIGVILLNSKGTVDPQEAGKPFSLYDDADVECKIVGSGIESYVEINGHSFFKFVVQ